MKRHSLIILAPLFMAQMMSGCASVTAYDIDLGATPISARVAVAPVSFFVNDGKDLVAAQPDEGLASIIHSYTVHYLRERHYGAFALLGPTTFMNDGERQVAAQYTAYKVADVIGMKDSGYDPAPYLADIQSKKLVDRVPFVLIPTFIKDPANLGMKILVSPGAFPARVQLYLIDMRTGDIVWQGEEKTGGTYKNIQMHLMESGMKLLTDKFQPTELQAAAVVTERK